VVPLALREFTSIRAQCRQKVRSAWAGGTGSATGSKPGDVELTVGKPRSDPSGPVHGERGLAHSRPAPGDSDRWRVTVPGGQGGGLGELVVTADETRQFDGELGGDG